MVQRDEPDHTRVRSPKAFLRRRLNGGLTPFNDGCARCWRRACRLDRWILCGILRCRSPSWSSRRSSVSPPTIGSASSSGATILRSWPPTYAYLLGAVGARVAQHHGISCVPRGPGRPTAPGSRDDLLSSLVHAEEEGHRLTLDELLANVLLLLTAGNETTTNLLGTASSRCSDIPTNCDGFGTTPPWFPRPSRSSCGTIAPCSSRPHCSRRRGMRRQADSSRGPRLGRAGGG